MRQFSRFFVPVLGFCMIVMIGCGKNDARYSKIEGVITYNQQPVEGATVTFSPVNYVDGAEPAAGRTDASGRYTLTSSGAVSGGTGILPGEYSVVVKKTTAAPDPDDVAFSAGKITYDELQARKAKSNRSPVITHLVPEKYGRSSTSGLKATVVSGKNPPFDFDLAN